MPQVTRETVRQWYTSANTLADATRGLGSKRVSSQYLENELGLPIHLSFLLHQADGEKALEPTIPFYSLCRGLFLPLSFLEPERTAQIFGLKTPPALDSAGREALLSDFLKRDIGLSLTEMVGCILGDPFQGRRSRFKRDSLVRLLRSEWMRPRRELMDRLSRVGDVAVLFAESRSDLRREPPLTAGEVLRTLYHLPDQPTIRRFDLLRSLLSRMGKVEAYFLAKLLLRKGFGFEFQSGLMARVLGERFGVTAEAVAHAMALTDAFTVTRILETEGPAGLQKIRLQPLVAVRPALASGTTDEIERYPVWVERKYDGIRLMLHKSTDAQGFVLCGAYTRTRNDWLELVPGLDSTIKQIPAANAIIDGELYGTVLDLEGSRPATVYEVYGMLQGEQARPVTLRYAAFDLIYWQGYDLTNLPLSERRQRLQALLTPLVGRPLPIPLTIAEGQLASNKADVQRLYQHFRGQGYEGIITKDLTGRYHLDTRDPNWRKRKPTITLDLVLVGGTFAVTTKQTAGLFGSYVIAARSADSGWEIVGDVAGVDVARDAQIQHEVMRDGLLTGRRIERPSASGMRAGVEFRPSIVVTVKFEGITRDQATGKLSLRDPKIAMLRSDKAAAEADTLDSLQEIYLRQRIG